jgi:hypothetical protein
MVRRMVHFLMAGWWLAWVLMIVPAHTRGAISLGGECAACAEGKVSFFFGTVKACCAGKHDGSGKESGDRPSSGNCAICQIVATTSNAAPALPVLTYLEMAGVLRPVAPSGAVHYAMIRSYQSRAPPAV